MGDEVTLGEVYRLLQAQSDDIAEIMKDVKIQNGRVNGHETRITILETSSGEKGKDTAARWGALGAGLAGLLGGWLGKP